MSQAAPASPPSPPGAPPGRGSTPPAGASGVTASGKTASGKTAPGGSSPSIPPEDKFPRRFAKYTLIRKLAVGGMAELFLALQRSVAGFEKLIVVKRILPSLVQDKAFAEMLLDEARIQATLNHPNVAHIYDVGVWEQQYYIAMEYIHGEDLRSIVRAMKTKGVTSFPLEHALAIVLGSAAGLSFAHDKKDLNGEAMNIVHRDVSPQNVLVTFTGDVKLVDFGIAKAGRSTMEDTKSGKLKGKVPYMSPEQAQGLPLDARTDIFALGVMLFELCTGRRLFRGANEFETLKMIVEQPYPAPRSVNPNLSVRLEQIIMKALEKDVARRYQTARELQQDLEDYIRNEQLAVSPLSLAEWMRMLFAEKLDAQKEQLLEGRQLAELVAAQTEEEERSLSGVRPKKTSKLPWVIIGVLVLAAVAGGVLLALQPGSSGPPRGPGSIVLASTPPGAAIWLDGERRAERTPATISNLPLGHYNVRLTADGFTPYSVELDLTQQALAGAVQAALVRPSASSLGVVRLRSTPSGAHVLLDGRDTGQTTPATLTGIEPQVDHALALALDNYVTKQATVNLRAGEVQDLSYDLERTPLGPTEAIVRVTITPAEARLLFDRDWHDSGSPYEFRVTAQRYRMVAAKTGFQSEERSVDLPGGRVTEVTFELDRDNDRPRTPREPSGERDNQNANTPPPSAGGPGTLTFDARPWCNVSIDGRPIGQTPVVNRSLPAGRHRITCTNPELNAERTINVDIQAGQPTRQRISLE